MFLTDLSSAVKEVIDISAGALLGDRPIFLLSTEFPSVELSRMMFSEEFPLLYVLPLFIRRGDAMFFFESSVDLECALHVQEA